uniref:Uncharacterized protein n=1 Tax=Manihot esculenta TaxID=3983 RepID=A0A2C9UVI1_MANES
MLICNMHASKPTQRLGRFPTTLHLRPIGFPGVLAAPLIASNRVFLLRSSIHFL